MAGTRLLVQCYFVFVFFGLLIPWAVYQSLDRNQVIVAASPAYVEFVALNHFPIEELAKSIEPQLAALSLRVKYRLGDPLRGDPLEYFFRTKEEFRFVVVHSNESRAFDAEGAGGVFYSNSTEDVSKAALQYVQGKMSLSDHHIQRALDSLDTLRSVSHLARKYDERPALRLIDSAIKEKSSVHAMQARRMIQAALSHPDLALPPHMYPEHVAAIYAPLILPLILPLLLSLKDEIKRYRRLTKLHLD